MGEARQLLLASLQQEARLHPRVGFPACNAGSRSRHHPHVPVRGAPHRGPRPQDASPPRPAASHRVKIRQLCFALTAASMVTARGRAGKAICRTRELEAGSPGSEEPEPQPQRGRGPCGYWKVRGAPVPFCGPCHVVMSCLLV